MSIEKIIVIITMILLICNQLTKMGTILITKRITDSLMSKRVENTTCSIASCKQQRRILNSKCHGTSDIRSHLLNTFETTSNHMSISNLYRERIQTSIAFHNSIQQSLIQIILSQSLCKTYMTIIEKNRLLTT